MSSFPIPAIRKRGPVLNGPTALPATTEMLVLDASGNITTQSIPVASFSALTGNPSDNAALSAALNGKVSLAGDTMTGALSIPINGTTASPALRVGTQVSGLTAGTNQLHFVVDGAVRAWADRNNLLNANAFNVRTPSGYYTINDDVYLYRNATGPSAEIRAAGGLRVMDATGVNRAKLEAYELQFQHQVRDEYGIGMRTQAGYLTFYGFNTLGSNSPTASISTDGFRVVGKSIIGAANYSEAFGSETLKVNGAISQNTTTSGDSFVSSVSGATKAKLVTNTGSGVTRLELWSSYVGVPQLNWYAEVGSSSGYGGFVSCPGGYMESANTDPGAFQYVSSVASSNYRQWITSAGTRQKFNRGTTLEWYNADYRADTNSSDLAVGRDSANTLGIYTDGTKATKGALACGAITASGNIALTGSNPNIGFGGTAAAGFPYIEHSSGSLNLGHTYANQLSVNASSITLRQPTTINNGTITASNPALNVTQTWNNGATVFNAIDVNVTNTASAMQSTFATFRRGGTNRIVLYDRCDNVAQGPGVQFGSGIVQEAAGGHVALGTTGDAGMVGLSNGLGLSMHPSRYIGWGSTGSATRDQGSAWTDLRLWRGGAGTLDVRGDGGILVRNLAASAWTPIQCGAITASGNIVISNAGPSFESRVPGYGSPFTFGGILSSDSTGRFVGASGAGLVLQGYSGASNSVAYRMQGHARQSSPTLPPFILESFKTNGADSRTSLASTEWAYGFYNGAYDASGTALLSIRGDGLIALMGLTSSFPAIKRNGTGIDFRLADDSAFTSIASGAITSSSNLTITPSASVTPPSNGQLTFEATSNTSLTVKYKGSDGVVRSNVLTLT
jgi:hypothetical protein